MKALIKEDVNPSDVKVLASSILLQINKYMEILNINIEKQRTNQSAIL